MVDVMLVLIIFMVTAPLLTVGVPLDLPPFPADMSASDVEVSVTVRFALR
jgi:biopolymer transport protein ExbD